MKTCPKCDEYKPISEYPFSTKRKDNIGYMCRACAVKATQASQKSLKGLVKKIFQNQKMTARVMGRSAPSYSELELFEWMLQHDYNDLWQTWVASDYDKWLSPSIDRKDNTISYTLDNIQLITWQQNLANQKNDNISGKYLHIHSKSVDQLSLDGVFITTFPSAANASRAMLGKRGCVSNITYVCTGRYKTAYGYKWKFSDAIS